MIEATFEQAYPMALRAAQVRVAGAVATARLTADERGECVQELLLAAWRSLPRYDNTRGSLRTYTERIVANRFSSLMRSRRRQLPVEALAEHHHQLVTLDGIPGLEFRMDVQRVLAALSERDRHLAQTLAERNVTQAARKLGRTRSSLYHRVYAIRTQFAKAGFGPRGGHSR